MVHVGQQDRYSSFLPGAADLTAQFSYRRYNLVRAFVSSFRGCEPLGRHRTFSKSQRPLASNSIPSRSSIRCCLSEGRTMPPVEQRPCELITRCHGVRSSHPCMTKPTVRGV